MDEEKLEAFKNTTIGIARKMLEAWFHIKKPNLFQAIGFFDEQKACEFIKKYDLLNVSEKQFNQPNHYLSGMGEHVLIECIYKHWYEATELLLDYPHIDWLKAKKGDYYALEISSINNTPPKIIQKLYQKNEAPIDENSFFKSFLFNLIATHEDNHHYLKDYTEFFKMYFTPSSILDDSANQAWNIGRHQCVDLLDFIMDLGDSLHVKALLDTHLIDEKRIQKALTRSIVHKDLDLKNTLESYLIEKEQQYLNQCFDNSKMAKKIKIQSS